MIITSIFGFLNSFFSLNQFSACLDIYILCFGVLSICLEYKDQVFMKRNVDIIKREAHFLATPWGRAAFYFFVGILVVSRGSIINLVAGIFLMIVGGVIYNSCRNAYSALNELHNAKYSEAILVKKFREFDHNKDAHLDTKEFSEVSFSVASIAG